ncbi:hypothetical protein NOF04DRAFT_9932 [Fusarium oxysporum II5]|uniref:Uncharacterized protein n=1 Tax=Fusarium odoratissimum (strain NRRL 54006) TaxID=1089451 RepID=X0J4H1_FUSO5|nr:uncharacterized protein FOIG_11577 [Fusarium odoratissimum NRRL 54006]EXL96037.1 hypothetical protein FOIG_11577 [Fusarium odoratissimum NRRL 54006]KAK2123825.1 hypothetical protein NOF04DRAFT_9932 [Fusarium oxysporum II5]
MPWSRYDLGQTNIFYDEAKPPLPSFVLPPHVEDVRRCLTDFSCLFNEKDESFHTISKDIGEGMDQGLNPDPIRKAAERIQHEVLSKVGGGYAENVWQDIFRKRFFDQLTDSLSLSKEDSRRVSRSIYYYDQVARSSDENWTLFESGKEATTSRLRPVKCPKPDQAFFLPIYHHRNNSGLPKVADPKARQWSHAGDSQPVEPFTWSTLQALNKFGLEPSPFRIFEKSPLEANLRCYPWLIIEHKKEKDQNEALERVVNCQGANAAACAISLVQQTAQYAVNLPRHAHIPPIPVITTVGPSVTVWLMYFAEDFDAPCSRRDTDEVITRRRKEGYIMRAIWKGDVKNLTDIMAFQMIIENTHTWATRVFKPLIASYIEQWKHIHSGQKTGMAADLLLTAKSEAFRQKTIEKRRLVVPMVRDLLDAPAGMELDDMAHKKVTPLFLGMLMHQICSTEREFISSQIDKAVMDRLQVIVTNGSTVTTQVEALHRVEATAQLPLRSQREETTQSSNSTQESQIPEVDNDDPDDSDYHPTSSESRSRSPSDAHTDDGDARSEAAVSVASTSAFSFSSFSKDSTVVWKPPSDPETPKSGSRSKKGPERPDILHRQSSQPSEDSDDATPKPTTVGHGIDFNFASPISGSRLERLGKNVLDGPPVFAGRSPPSQPKWPPGRKFVSPKTQSSPKAPMHRGDIITSPPADPKAKLYIDLTSDSQRDHPNTKE